MTKKAQSELANFAGIDVGAQQLHLVRRSNGVSSKPQAFANTPRERRELAKKLAKVPNLIVCLEATGVYHQDLALALHDAGDGAQPESGAQLCQGAAPRQQDRFVGC